MSFYMGQCISKSSYILIFPQRFLPVSKFKVNEPICIGPYNLRTLALFQTLLRVLRPQILCHELVLNKASYVLLCVQWCDSNKISITIPKGGHRDTEEGWTKVRPNHNRANILSCISMSVIRWHDMSAKGFGTMIFLAVERLLFRSWHVVYT